MPSTSDRAPRQPPALVVAIDTNEKHPWAWDAGLVSPHPQHLRTGDYALVGDSDFAVERKELGDFVDTILNDYQPHQPDSESRFGRELARAGDRGLVVVVEGTLSEALAACPPWSNGTDTRRMLLQKLAALSLRGVPVIFADWRDGGATVAYWLLRERRWGKKTIMEKVLETEQ